MENFFTEPSKLEKVVGCHLGNRMGDGMGMAYETMSPKRILFATGGQGVTGFSKPVQRRIEETRLLEPGDPTDDWRLMRAVTKSLIFCGGFNLMHQAREHLLELEDDYVGFGSSTLQNLLQIRATAPPDWKTNPQVQLKLPRWSELLKSGTGNGVAMKIAPLALFFHYDHELLWQATMELASLTHRDPQAAIAAFSIASLNSRLYRQSVGLTGPTNLAIELQQLMQAVTDETIQLQQRYLTQLGYTYPLDDTDFSLKLKELNRLVQSGELADLELVRENIGTGFYCAESIPFAMAMFLRHPLDFRAGLLETINSGGDTDTNAAMSGALIGTNVGAGGIPAVWREFRPDFQEAGYLALALYKIMK